MILFTFGVATQLNIATAQDTYGPGTIRTLRGTSRGMELPRNVVRPKTVIRSGSVVPRVHPSRREPIADLMLKLPEASFDGRQRENKDSISRSLNREDNRSNLWNEDDVVLKPPVIVRSPEQTRSTDRQSSNQPDMPFDTSVWNRFESDRGTAPNFDSVVRRTAQQHANSVNASIPAVAEPVEWSSRTEGSRAPTLPIQSEKTELLLRSLNSASEERPDKPLDAVDVTQPAVVPDTPDLETRHNAQLIPSLDFEKNSQEPAGITQVAAAQPQLNGIASDPVTTTPLAAVVGSNALNGQSQIAVFLGIVAILLAGLIVVMVFYRSSNMSPVLPSVIRLEITGGDTSAAWGLLTKLSQHDDSHAAREIHPETVVVEVGETDLPAGLGLRQTFVDQENQAAETLRRQSAEICKSLFEHNLELQQAITRT